MVLSESGEPLTEEAVATAEKRLGRSIPPTYRAFLLRHNGGIPEPGNFVVRFDDGRDDLDVTLDWFLGLNVTYGVDLEWHVGEYQSRIPSDLFPIATDPGGNLILIGAKGRNKGKIYYWDHDEEEEGSPTYDNVHKLADSLTAFLESLN